MSWISQIIGSSFGKIVDGVEKIADEFHLSGEEKNQFKLQMQELLQKRSSEVENTIRAELQAKERVLVAELNQGDRYTKRARPSIVYCGLIFIFLNYCVLPSVAFFTGMDTSSLMLSLPTGFWTAWTGICATWSIGRTMEKSGISNKFTSIITGNNKPVILD